MTSLTIRRTFAVLATAALATFLASTLAVKAQPAEPATGKGKPTGTGRTLPRAAEAKEVDAVLARHRGRAADERASRARGFSRLLTTAIPADPAGRKKWRDDIKATLAAERKAQEAAEDALRAELQHVEKALRPDDDDGPGS